MSVKQRKNGKWEVRYRDPEGRNRSKSFRRKRDALAYEDSVRTQMNNGSYQAPTNCTKSLGEVFQEYLNSKRNLKPKSIEEIRSIWNHIIAPTFEQTRLSTINLERITKWVNQSIYSDQPLTSAYRMNKALGYLSRILEYAIDLGYISHNPTLKANGKQYKVKNVEKHNKRPPKALSLDELKQLANHCGDFKDMVLLMGICGLRWAEIVGLKVNDFSDDCRRLKISRTLSEVGGIFYETTTKTDQFRWIHIPKTIAEMIQQRNSCKDSQDLVFTNSVGQPIHNSNFRKRIYLPAIRKAQVPLVTIHDLRHTAASISISSGLDITSVAQMLGHQDTSMTLRRYSHYYDKTLVNLSVELDKLINNSF